MRYITIPKEILKSEIDLDIFVFKNVVWNKNLLFLFVKVDEFYYIPRWRENEDLNIIKSYIND